METKAQGIFENCSIDGHSRFGVLSRFGNTSTMKQCRFSRNKIALRSKMKGKIVATDCEFDDNGKIFKTGFSGSRISIVESDALFLERAGISKEGHELALALREVLAQLGRCESNEIISVFTPDEYCRYCRCFDSWDEDDFLLQLEVHLENLKEPQQDYLRLLAEYVNRQIQLKKEVLPPFYYLRFFCFYQEKGTPSLGNWVHDIVKGILNKDT